MKDLNGKVAVITGASRGIGAGLARVFLARGMKVAACARHEPETPLESRDRWLFSKADVRDAAAMEELARRTWRELGPIDLWVNNAGVLEPVGMVRDLDPGHFADHLAVNVCGVFNGTRAFLRLCHEHGRGGTLVNISSGAAHSPYPGWGAYCSGKAAVDMLSRVTAMEERPHGIRVFALAPGIIETAMQETIRRKSAEEFPAVEKFRELKASGALAEPESPAPAILRLAFGDPLPEEEVVLDVRDSPALRDLES